MPVEKHILKISERNFKTVMDALWGTFTDSVKLVATLEYIGLEVSDSESQHPEMGSFSCLYGMQDMAARTLLGVLDIDPELPGLDGGQGGPGTLMEEIDQYLYDVWEEYQPCCEKFPDEAYDGLYDIVQAIARVELVWPDDKPAPDLPGADAEGAYWDDAEFGAYSPERMDELKAGGLKRWETTLSRTGGMTVWAKDADQAMNIVDGMDDAAVSAFACFEGASATDAYEADE